METHFQKLLLKFTWSFVGTHNNIGIRKRGEQFPQSKKQSKTKPDILQNSINASMRRYFCFWQLLKKDRFCKSDPTKFWIQSRYAKPTPRIPPTRPLHHTRCLSFHFSFHDASSLRSIVGNVIECESHRPKFTDSRWWTASLCGRSSHVSCSHFEKSSARVLRKHLWWRTQWGNILFRRTEVWRVQPVYEIQGGPTPRLTHETPRKPPSKI